MQIYGGGTNWAKAIPLVYSGVASKTDGTLWTWGDGGYGQLGQNNTTSRSSPVQVPGTTWVNNNDYSFVSGQWNAFVLKSS